MRSQAALCGQIGVAKRNARPIRNVHHRQDELALIEGGYSMIAANRPQIGSYKLALSNKVKQQCCKQVLI